MSYAYFPLLVVLVVAAIIAIAIIVLSSLFPRRHGTPIKLMPYECGMDPVGDARRRFSVRFFIIGMLFIVFDIEMIFLFPWATIYDELRIFGFIEMLVFVMVLLVGLLYAWRKGALEWE